jgi:mitochondrial chaperone BCS1
MSSEEPLSSGLAVVQSSISSAWHFLLNLDQSSLLGVGLSLAALSATVRYAKDLVYGFARATCISSIRVNEDGLLFGYVMRWVIETKLSNAHQAIEASIPLFNTWQSEIEAHNQVSNSKITYEGKDVMSYRARSNMRPIRYRPFTGGHLFWYKGRPVMLSHHEWPGVTKTGNSRPSYFICLETFGRSSDILKNLLQEAQVYCLTHAGEDTTIFRPEMGDDHRPANWSIASSKPPRQLNTVVLDEEKKRLLMDDITDYLRPTSRQWYLDRGIPYRRGYLFSGPPGTGM